MRKIGNAFHSAASTFVLSRCWLMAISFIYSGTVYPLIQVCRENWRLGENAWISKGAEIVMFPREKRGTKQEKQRPIGTAFEYVAAFPLCVIQNFGPSCSVTYCSISIASYPTAPRSIVSPCRNFLCLINAWMRLR